MGPTLSEYKLCWFEQIHNSDIKTIDVSYEEATDVDGSVSIFTGSRDSAIKCSSWDRHYGSIQSQLVHSEHNSFVNSVKFVPSSQEYSQGLLISGGSDKVIYAWDLARSQVAYVLLGHDSNICHLEYKHSTSTLISCSWDHTARVWSDRICKFTLAGHAAAVWCAKCVGNEERFLTASADKTIKLWEGEKCVATFTGHSDCVRTLAVLDEARGEFASGGNDGKIIIWRFDGTRVAEWQAHESYIYSMDICRTGSQELPMLLVSVGEDRVVKLWDYSGTCLQAIPIPAISIWCVRAVNKDIFVGTNEGTLCVFSRNEHHINLATNESLDKFQSKLSAMTISKSTLVDSVADPNLLDPSKLAGLDALNTPGKWIGQNKIVSVGDGTIVAYQWSGQEWTKVGTVVDNPSGDAASKKIINGIEYDYAFDVDIEDNGIPLKLYFNAADNPYNVAQSFVTRNELPLEYVNQIVDFILKNTLPTTISAEKADSAVVWKTQFERIAVYNIEGIYKKILELNKEHVANELRLSSLQIAEFTNCINCIKLHGIGAVEAAKHLEPLYPTIIPTLLQWPTEKLFPVLDLIRVLLLNTTSYNYPFLNQLYQRITKDIISHPQSTIVNSVMKLRILINMFGHAVCTPWLVKCIGSNLEFAKNVAEHASIKEQELPFMLLLNYALLSKQEPTIIIELVQYLHAMISICDSDACKVLLVHSIKAAKPALEPSQFASLQTQLSMFQSDPLIFSLVQSL